MRCNTMFITAVCVIFLIKIRWPKKKSLTKLIPVYYLTPLNPPPPNFSFSFLVIFNVKRHGQLADLALFKCFDIFLVVVV